MYNVTEECANTSCMSEQCVLLPIPLSVCEHTVAVNKCLRNVPVVRTYYASTVARSTQEVRKKYARSTPAIHDVRL